MRPSLVYAILLLLVSAAACTSRDTPHPAAVTFTYTGAAQNFTPLAFQSTAPGAETYAWDFGDAGTSQLANPSHTFRKAGRYLVTLTVSGTQGTAATSQTLILAQADTLGIIADGIAGLYEFHKVIRRTVNADKSVAFTARPDTTMTIQRVGGGLVVHKRAFFHRGVYPWLGVNTFTTPSYYYYENVGTNPALLKVQQQGDSVYIGLPNAAVGSESATYFYGRRKR